MDAVVSSRTIGTRNCLVIPSSRLARFTTGPKTVTFTCSDVPIFPATAQTMRNANPDLKAAERMVRAAERLLERGPNS